MRVGFGFPSEPRTPGPEIGVERAVLWIGGVLAVLILVPVAGIFLFLFALGHSIDEHGKEVSAADALEQLLHPGTRSAR
jgi:hypothetical protein